MADATKPPATVPGNMSGSFAAGVAAVAVAWLTKMGYITLMATAIGLPEAHIVALIGGVIVMAVSYAATHITAIKSVKQLWEAMPSTTPTYPNDPKPATSQGQSNANINKA